MAAVKALALSVLALLLLGPATACPDFLGELLHIATPQQKAAFEKLELSADQTQQLRMLINKNVMEVRRLSGSATGKAKLAIMLRQTLKELNAFLTPAQRKQLKAIKINPRQWGAIKAVFD